MGGTKAFSGTPDGFGRIIGIEERHRSKPHQGAVAGAVRICGARVGVLVGVLREPVQRRSHGVADVEAAPGAAQVSVPVPAEVPLHLVTSIKPPALDQTCGEAECHRGIIRPLAGLEAKRSAAHQVRDRREGVRSGKLHRRAHGVSGSQPQQRTAVAVLEIGHVLACAGSVQIG
jgi:hypothetical protein